MNDTKKFNYNFGEQTSFAKAVEEGTTIQPDEAIDLDNEQQQKLCKQYRSIVEGQHDKVFLVGGIMGVIVMYLAFPKFIIGAIILLIISYIVMKFSISKQCNKIIDKLGYVPEVNEAKSFSISKILGGKK